MEVFTYQLPIAKKIEMIRNGGFKVVTRAEAEKVITIPADEIGGFVIYSEAWILNGEIDPGMVMAGDDPIILEATFAEAWADDSWAEGVDVGAVTRAYEQTKRELKRRHLSVVK